MTENPVQVKICGIREKQHLEAAIKAGADYIGFIFVEDSCRAVTPQHAASLVDDLSHYIRPEGRKIVAVMADPTDKELADVLSVLSPDILQLHGSESRERVREIGNLYDIRIMKALAVCSPADIAAAKDYVGYADMLLFDARAADGTTGGTGTHFDWTLLTDQKIRLPWFLSGGLNASNILEAISITGAKMVDVSSGVERSRGQKDSQLIQDFVALVKDTFGTGEENQNA
ncbi:MAG: phosphoribosylanthranilate isomerase [Alphaproteobacteria bacterium]|nr:phosphoribosylanthranilate isomerase [Alphaproteobacteria bacterium]